MISTNTSTLNPKNSKDFAVIYEKTGALLIYVAGQLGIAREEREDIAQQAYLKLLESGAEFTLEHAKAYLTCTVRTLVIDRSRRRATRKTDTAGDWTGIVERPMWESDTEHQTAVAAVAKALSDLGSDAQVLVWFYRDGLSVEEIRARLGGATGTVTAKLCRLRQKHAPALRAAVEDAVGQLAR
jgi:RNA polymerase sigma factor (sigma-70 family)